MKVGEPLPQARIWRGGTNPVGLIVRERSFLPAASTGNASGALSEAEAYRVIVGDDAPSVLRITNRENSSAIFNIVVLWTEEADPDT